MVVVRPSWLFLLEQNIMTGQQCKVLRMYYKLKQLELVRLAGIPQVELSLFENGHRSLSRDKLKKVKKVFEKLEKLQGEKEYATQKNVKKN